MWSIANALARSFLESDASNFDLAFTIGKQLDGIVLDEDTDIYEGDWISLALPSPMQHSRMIHCYVAHMRWGDPKQALYTLADVSFEACEIRGMTLKRNSTLSLPQDRIRACQGPAAGPQPRSSRQPHRA